MSAASVHQLVPRRAREAEDLDFKGELYRRDDPDLAKDVAAMANTLGGVIVLGVEEQQELASATPGVELAASHVQSMWSMVGSRVRPFPSFEIHAVADDAAADHGFYVIVVSPSAAAPFLVFVRNLGAGTAHDVRLTSPAVVDGRGPFTEDLPPSLMLEPDEEASVSISQPSLRMAPTYTVRVTWRDGRGEQRWTQEVGSQAPR